MYLTIDIIHGTIYDLTVLSSGVAKGGFRLPGNPPAGKKLVGTEDAHVQSRAGIRHNMCSIAPSERHYLRSPTYMYVHVMAR